MMATHITHLDLYTIEGAMRRERKRYESRLARSDFVPEPGRVNMDEVNVDKYTRLEAFFGELIRWLNEMTPSMETRSAERIVQAGLLENWEVRYELLDELDRLRAEIDRLHNREEDHQG